MISCENISYSYADGTLALKDLSIDFSKGDVTAVIGSNGAGKSTLFMNIMGILRPSMGQITWNNKKIDYSRKFLSKYRAYVNMVFQDPDRQIFFNRIYDDVAFALRNLGYKEEEVEKRVMESLKICKIEDLVEKPVHFLSYGQKKRVAIASVLAMDCQMLLLDEPTAGLDPRMTGEIVSLIHDLKDSGKKLIVSSHDMDFIYDISDYVYIMDKGEIVHEGNKKEVFLDNELIYGVGLEQPNLVRLHVQGSIPLFTEEKDLMEYLRNHK